MLRSSVLVLLLVLVPSVAAQRVELKSGFLDEFIVLGQAGRFVVDVGIELPADSKAEPDVEFPDFPQVRGLHFEATGGGLTSSGTRMVIEGGRRRDSVTYRGRWEWKVTADALGRYGMPEIQVKVAGQTYRSRPNPGTVEVAEEAPGNRFVGAMVAISNPRPYVNQPIRLRYVLTSERTIVQTSQSIPELEIPWAGSPAGFQAEPTKLAEPRDQTSLYATLQGERVKVDQKIFNDRKPPVIEVSLEKTLIPLAPGTIDLGGTKVGLEIADSTRRSGFRGTEYIGRRKAFVTTENITLEVRDAPMAGRPKSFRGAIGDFRAELSYSSGKIRAGDSVNLTLKLSGSDIVDLIEIPDVGEHFPNFRALPAPKDARGEAESREVIYSWFLKPLDNSVTEVPAFEFSWFSPEKERFSSVALEAMPLEITGEIEEGSIFGGSNRAERASLAVLGEGLRPLEDEPGASVDLRPTLPVSWFLVVLLLPVFSLFALSFWTRKRERFSGDLNLQRRKKASKAAQARLAEAQSLLGQKGFHGKLARSLSGFIADKLGLPPASVSAATVRNLLGQAEVDPAAIEATAALLDELDHAAFGGGQASPEEERAWLARAEDLLARLDREVRS